jgi:hypothetical protein
MFKVLVLACSISIPTDCWEFHDTRGPYATRDLCQARAFEMRQAIMEMPDRDLMPMNFRCDKLQGSML